MLDRVIDMLRYSSLFCFLSRSLLREYCSRELARPSPAGVAFEWYTLIVLDHGTSGMDQRMLSQTAAAPLWLNGTFA